MYLKKGKKDTYKWMVKDLLININLGPLSRFDILFNIWNYENFSKKVF